MAKSNPAGTVLNRLPKLVERIEAKMSDAADARGDLGSIYKEVEDLGLNRSALKLAIKLRNMEPAKRNDFVSSLQAYCETLGVWGQGDMLADAPRGIGPTDGDAAAEATPPTTDVSEIRDQGYRDGLSGRDVRSEYAPDSPQKDAYVEGWIDGQRELAGDTSGKAPTGTRRRGRPRKDATSLSEIEAAGAA